MYPTLPSIATPPTPHHDSALSHRLCSLALSLSCNGAAFQFTLPPCLRFQLSTRSGFKTLNSSVASSFKCEKAIVISCSWLLPSIVVAPLLPSRSFLLKPNRCPIKLNRSPVLSLISFSARTSSK